MTTRLVAGVDVGNATTEAAIARLEQGSTPRFVGTALSPTTGLKGTIQNLEGIETALRRAAEKAGVAVEALDVVLLNDAAPVVAGMAMQTITETMVTESTMVGHNPSTPGGYGLGAGTLIPFAALSAEPNGESVIVAIPESVRFSEAARAIATALGRGWPVAGLIVQRDDGVLIANRLTVTLPIVDEVAAFDLLPLGQRAAVEVAHAGHQVQAICNPYALAGLLGLDPEETRRVAPIARALVGLRSGVVARLPAGQMQGRTIRAGILTVHGRRREMVDTRSGAEAIMRAVDAAWPLSDVDGEPGTNAGAMLGTLRATMSEITGEAAEAIRVRDLLAVDALVAQAVAGAVADGTTLESAVGLAALVQTSHRPLGALAAALSTRLSIRAGVGGVEAEMALRGALTSPGVSLPVAIVDMGAGSVDAASPAGDGLRSVHLAGAGELVTLLIDASLGLNDRDLAEQIKRRPAAWVEDLFRLRLEDGTVRFLPEPVPAHLFGRVVLLAEDGIGELTGLPPHLHLDKVRSSRQEFKAKVLVYNTLRALRSISTYGDLREFSAVVLVGGCALDFEIPAMLTRCLAELGIVAGSANVRGSQGPRNAVATGLILAHAQDLGHL
jgi:diol dehydratase reactivase alpha subunit